MKITIGLETMNVACDENWKKVVIDSGEFHIGGKTYKVKKIEAMLCLGIGELHIFAEET